jgi:hypothetical protein
MNGLLLFEPTKIVDYAAILLKSRNRTFKACTGNQILSSFASDSTLVALDNQNLYLSKGTKIDVCNYQGIVKQDLPLVEAEGEVTQLAVIPGYLVVVSASFKLQTRKQD